MSINTIESQNVKFEELLKDKKFITKEYYEKPEPIEEDPDTVDFAYGKNKEPELPVIDPNKGIVDAFPSIQNKVIGLYFSAGWCPPCRQFTPLLKALHEELEERNCPFQVVFISFDKKEEDMEEYFVNHHGNWLAVPFKDPLIEEWKNIYEVNAVPKLIIIQDSGEIITRKGRKEVQDRGYLSYRSWKEVANLVNGGSFNTLKDLEKTEGTGNDKMT